MSLWISEIWTVSKTLVRRDRDESRDIKAAQKRKPETRKSDKRQWEMEIEDDLVPESTDNEGYWG